MVISDTLCVQGYKISTWAYYTNEVVGAVLATNLRYERMFSVSKPLQVVMTVPNISGLARSADVIVILNS